MLEFVKNKIMLAVALLMFTSASLSAQYSPGSWTSFPMSSEFYDYVLDTPAKFFYMTGGSLYSYDKEYQETYFYSPGSSISDSGIDEIYYNPAGEYVLIVYQNSNIDLIYEDGTIVNLPEIKDANLTVSKTINHVMFCNNRIYVATDFGIVIYDDQKHLVVESGILNTQIQKIMATDEHLLIFSNYKLYFSPINERHNTFDKFEKLADMNIHLVQQVDNNKFLYIHSSGGDGAAYVMTLDLPNKKILSYDKKASTPKATTLLPYKDGFFVLCDSGIVLLDKEGNHVETKKLSDDIKSQLIAMWEGIQSVWAADRNGVANYNLTTEPLTVVSDKYKVPSSMQFGAGSCIPSWDGLSVYVTQMGLSEVHPAGNAVTSMDIPFICEKYDWAERSFTQVHPYGVSNSSSNAQNEAKKRNSQLFYGGPGVTAIDPVDPEIIYHANNFEGLIVFKNGELLREFNKTNSPLFFDWGTRIFDAVFDRNGNLWVGGWRGATTSEIPAQTKTIYKILPASALEKLRKDPASVDMNDWIDSNFPTSEPGKMDMHLLFSSKTNKGIYIRGCWEGPIIGLDTKGTTETTDDAHTIYTILLDQDGTNSWPNFRTCMVEDLSGNIWLGTSAGIYVIEDIEQIANSHSNNLNVRRPKVARNDGTNYADYLLSSETILSIAVDPSNRKWIATDASGLYLVSADGTEILQQFTTDNSPLLSNTIYTVACDPNGNDILVSTADGMYLYSSTSSPAADDFSEVYVYPNPVRPDYTGWITIEGLMESSLVKIADMHGNVFWQGKSEGGMVVWDGCNSSGERVSAGVYFVVASKSDGNSSEGVVAKIVVIK